MFREIRPMYLAGKRLETIVRVFVNDEREGNGKRSSARRQFQIFRGHRTILCGDRRNMASGRIGRDSRNDPLLTSYSPLTRSMIRSRFDMATAPTMAEPAPMISSPFFIPRKMPTPRPISSAEIG